MASNKIITVLAAWSALALFAVTSSASAGPIVKEEQEQIGSSIVTLSFGGCRLVPALRQGTAFLIQPAHRCEGEPLEVIARAHSLIDRQNNS